MNSHDREKLYFPMFMLSLVIILANAYWFGYGFIVRAVDLNDPDNVMVAKAIQVINNLLVRFNRSEVFSTPYKTKAFDLLIIFATFILKAGKKTSASWPTVIAILSSGLLLYLAPVTTPFLYILVTLTGFVLTCVGIALMGRKFSGAKQEDNDIFETFEQCTKKPIETDYSINIPLSYQYLKRRHRGYVNCISPQAGTMILGAPGTGKSFSVVHSFIETMIHKNFSLYVYDFKLPDLTKIVYNIYLEKYKYAEAKVKAYCGSLEDRKAFDSAHADDKEKTPQFCLINFDNPRQSMRCNPLSPRYLTEMADAHELANLIMANVNPKSVESEDFFVMSAKAMIAAYIWLLRLYKNGIYCTFPHLVELMGQNYKAVFDILKSEEDLFIMVQPFADALEGNAMEQLQGQIASARMPLLKFPSDSFYWVLTGDDFTLDINNADAPKILCMGNNPDRQETYSTVLSLYTSRIIKITNHKTNSKGVKNRPCGLIVDEFPTCYIHKVDNVIATARSNDVCVVLAAQDQSQIRRDYGDKNAAVIMNTVGNIFSGRVNGDTAKSMAETFGEEFRLQESETTGGESDTVSSSFHLQKILPQSRIETLTNGYFFGKVADTNDHPIDHKLFCGKIIVDVDARKKQSGKWKKLPDFGAHYFNDSAEEAYVDAHREECIKDVIRQEIIDQNYNDRLMNHAIPEVSENRLRLEVKDRFAALDDHMLKEYADRAKQQRKDRAMNVIMRENAARIRDDIHEIFAYYKINLDKYAKPDAKGNIKGMPAGPAGGAGGAGKPADILEAADTAVS